MQQGTLLLTGMALLGWRKPWLAARGILSADRPIGVGDWQRYENLDYGFALQYPTEWRVETTIHQDVPFAYPSAIINRQIFSAPYARIYLDIWLARSRDLSVWLQEYANTSLIKGLSTESNAEVAGQKAVMALHEGHPIDTLTTFLNDGKYTYRLLYMVTGGLNGAQTYWRMLDTFTLPGTNPSPSMAHIPQGMKRDVEQTAESNKILLSSCCGYTHPSNPFPCCSDGNCTWWAYYKMNCVPFTGNASTWWGDVPNYPGWLRNSSPPWNKRSVAYWPANYNGAGQWGHVAYLNNYTGGGTITISEMGCEDSYNCVRTRSISTSNPYGYIYRQYEPESEES